MDDFTRGHIKAESLLVKPQLLELNGRGVKRWKLDRDGCNSLAADLVAGAVHLRPSITQACLLIPGATPLQVRRILQARNGNGAVVKNWRPRPSITDADLDQLDEKRLRDALLRKAFRRYLDGRVEIPPTLHDVEGRV
jgi:hypothetical protein